MSEGFRLTRLTGVTARIVAHDWAFPRENADAIAAHWQERVRRSPGMFDGTVLMSCGHAVADGVAQVDLFAVRYATFTAYRSFAVADPRVVNAFAAIVPWTADGAVLLGEMGAHTANAGQLYFPCGTPDPDDVRGDAVDLAGSAARELAEETGLLLPEGAGTAWVLLEGEGQLAFLRPVRFPDTAAVLDARIAAHLRAEAEPELAGMHVVRGVDDVDPARMPSFVRAYLTDAFPAAG
jgi:8-oxo-dGTP pyrophosphatase MutT (NUDIX family)